MSCVPPPVSRGGMGEEEESQPEDNSPKQSQQEAQAPEAEVPPLESPEKTQLKDWEILNSGPETKRGDGSGRKSIPGQVKEIQRQVKERVMMLQPAAMPLLQKMDQVWLRGSALQDKYSKQTDEALKVGCAVALLLAGGRFPVTIACAQSFHMACWQTMKTTLLELRDSYTSSAAQRNLSEVSLSDFGRTLKELLFSESPADREAAKRRALEIATCVDPNKMRNALRGLWPGVIAVIATLRSRFAFAVGLGANVGQMVNETIQQATEERLNKLSLDNRKWTDVALQQGCGAVSFCLSFYAARIMNALNSALQGSTALTKVLFQYFKSQQDLPEGNRSTIGKCVLPLLGKATPRMGKEQEMVKWIIAMVGFSYQVRHRLQLPLPARVPLAPLYLTEYFLTRLASARSL